jgi:hypothetical protein
MAETYGPIITRMVKAQLLLLHFLWIRRARNRILNPKAKEQK